MTKDRARPAQTPERQDSREVSPRAKVPRQRRKKERAEVLAKVLRYLTFLRKKRLHSASTTTTRLTFLV
jgi:hypothetical protein